MSRILKIVDHHGRPIRAAAYSGAFEGASMGRRLGQWGTNTSGANAVLFSSLSTLRSRAREMVRNNPLADGAEDTWVSNLIGTGISPRVQLDDAGLKRDIHQLWEDWVPEADADGRCDFYGLQTLGARSLFHAGEYLALLRPRLPEDGLAVPFQLQLLEPDHLDHTYNTQAENGHQIRMGIEIDAIGRRTAYHLFQDHPGEMFPSQSMTRKPVPASQVLHVFESLRPGQLRGKPKLASVILKLKDIEECDDAELVRRKTTALFGGFFTENGQGSESDLDTVREVLGPASEADASIPALEPGSFSKLPRGLDVKFAEPKDVSGAYVGWIQHNLRSAARGVGITYEQLTGDLTNVNYSSIRAGLLEFRRRIKRFQFQVLAHQFCRPVFNAWLDAAVLSGALRLPNYNTRTRRAYRRVEWRPDGWEWVDPQKDGRAAKEAVRDGFKSRAQVVAEGGGDVDVVDQEMAEDNARADKLGLVLDTDPRKTTYQGAASNQEEDGGGNQGGDS